METTLLYPFDENGNFDWKSFSYPILGTEWILSSILCPNSILIPQTEEYYERFCIPYYRFFYEDETNHRSILSVYNKYRDDDKNYSLNLDDYYQPYDYIEQDKELSLPVSIEEHNVMVERFEDDWDLIHDNQLLCHVEHHIVQRLFYNIASIGMSSMSSLDYYVKFITELYTVLNLRILIEVNDIPEVDKGKHYVYKQYETFPNDIQKLEDDGSIHKSSDDLCNEQGYIGEFKNNVKVRIHFLFENSHDFKYHKLKNPEMIEYTRQLREIIENQDCDI